MLELKFDVSGQHIARRDRARVVAGSRNYLSCRFTFDSAWAETVKTAIFTNGTVSYNVVLTNDAIAASAMPVFSAGTWHVSVFGGNLITADTATLVVYPSGYTTGTAPAAPTSTVYETLTARIAALTTLIGTFESTMTSVSNGTLYLGTEGDDSDA